nr:immunoglobulin light chain junction region [Macaca mulatta]MOV35084.1 immunoglobulin light chain junction region [Macaca mulatta]MOV35399.1 immunoglobulin light chain junction region [Macaca mulatta]
CLQYRNYPRTF